jgi:hypothetical protein
MEPGQGENNAGCSEDIGLDAYSRTNGIWAWMFSLGLLLRLPPPENPEGLPALEEFRRSTDSIR